MDELRGQLLEVSELLVPGLTAADGAPYLLGRLDELEPSQRDEIGAAIARLYESGDGPLATRLTAAVGSPALLQLRALAVEAYYSGYRGPAARGPSSWDRIGFSTPVTRREVREYSFGREAGW